MIVGIRRHKPSYALPWWLFAVGFVLYWMGDVYTYSYRVYILHHEVPFPSIGDAIYLSVYPAQMLGLLLLVRRRNPQRNRNTLIDAAILTLGLSLLSWVLLDRALHSRRLVGPAAQAGVGRLSTGRRPTLAATIRLLLDSGPRSRPSTCSARASDSLLVTDFVYGVMTLDNAYHHQLVLDLGWFSYQLLWGAAALHPSMVALDKPVKTQGAKLNASGVEPAHRRLADRAGVHPPARSRAAATST